MRIEDVISAWNAQADEYNQWDALDADERVEFALQQAGNKAARLREFAEEVRRTGDTRLANMAIAVLAYNVIYTTPDVV